MKLFTTSDIDTKGSFPRISCDREDLKYDPVWYHKRGLMQTSSGYNRKLSTEWKLSLNNRLYRVYCCIFSNSGTRYILVNKKWVIVDAM